MMYHAGKERNKRKAQGEKKDEGGVWKGLACLGKGSRKLEMERSIELKRFLDTYFTTKNHFRALDL